jgi:hypothetical protein
MICSGLCFLPFIENPPDLKGLLDSHNTWINFRGAFQCGSVGVFRAVMAETDTLGGVTPLEHTSMSTESEIEKQRRQQEKLAEKALLKEQKRDARSRNTTK